MTRMMNERVVAEGFRWPGLRELAENLGSEMEPTAGDLIRHSLFGPIDEFLARPGKKFRARLVELAFRLSRPESKRGLSRRQKEGCERAAWILETIHAGALIIDDIQDGSPVRRNGPAFHVRHGVARSINAGNWLYFWSLAQVQALGLPPRTELQAHRRCLEVMHRAHLGQAIDIGTPIDAIPQQRVPSVCMSSMRLKTGVLMSLAMILGGMLGGAGPGTLEELERLGCELGVSLQMFDDAGTFSSTSAQPAKRYEDLRLKRPSWSWAFAAQEHSARDYQDFARAASHLPDESYLKYWVGLHGFEHALKASASARLASIIQSFNERYGVSHPLALGELAEMTRQLESCYG